MIFKDISQNVMFGKYFYGDKITFLLFVFSRNFIFLKKCGIILNDSIGCNVEEQTKIIGFTPQDACAIVEEALKNKNNWLVGESHQKFHM